MSELDDARARVAHLEAQAELEQDLADAATAHEASPGPGTLAAHNAAAEALAAHRQAARQGGVKVTGDATLDAPAEGN